jgi:hypothetical protein
MKVNTSNFMGTSYLTEVQGSVLNYGGGCFPHTEGYLNPEIGNLTEIIKVDVVFYIVDANNNPVKNTGQQNPIECYLSNLGNNKIHFAAQAPVGWLEFGPGYRLSAAIYVDFLEGGITCHKGWYAQWSVDLSPVNIPDLSVSASVDRMIGNPNHSLNISASYNANGASILNKYIYVDKGSGWELVYQNGANFAVSKLYTDSTSPITYNVKVELEYQTVIFGVTVRFTRYAYASASYAPEYSVPTLSLSSSIDPMPTKPIYGVLLSANIINTGGCTITDKKLSVDSHQITVFGNNPFTGSYAGTKSPSSVTHQTKAEIFWTAPNGQQGSVSKTGTVTYYGEVLQA